MPKAIHLLCRREGASLRNLDHLDGDTYRSGWWKIPEADAHALIGGWIYLHETKGEPSAFGGVVTAVERGQPENGEDRFGLVLEARREGRGQRWRGAEHGMAWTGGPIDGSLPHEID